MAGCLGGLKWAGREATSCPEMAPGILATTTSWVACNGLPVGRRPMPRATQGKPPIQRSPSANQGIFGSASGGSQTVNSTHFTPRTAGISVCRNSVNPGVSFRNVRNLFSSFPLPYRSENGILGRGLVSRNRARDFPARVAETARELRS